MSDGQLLDLERQHDNAKTNAKMGMYISGAGVLLLLAKFVWGIDVSDALSGMLVGGGFVFWCFCHDKTKKVRRKMDEICYLKYGKSHHQAYIDIREDRFNSGSR